MKGELDWAQITQLILALATFVAALGTLRKSAGNSVKLDEVKKATDGLSTTAQNEARTAGQAVGEAKGRADAVADQGADALARERGMPPRPPT